jgi:hypothetical protein
MAGTREGSTLPTSVLRDKGRAESLPHLFWGGDTLPFGFEGNAEGFIPSARVFESNGEGGLLCPHFQCDTGRVDPSPPFSTRHGEVEALPVGIEDNRKGVSPSPPIFEANTEVMTSPTIFDAAWTTPPLFFCVFLYIFHTKSVINKYTMKNIIIIIIFYMKYNT